MCTFVIIFFKGIYFVLSNIQILFVLLVENILFFYFIYIVFLYGQLKKTNFS